MTDHLIWAADAAAIVLALFAGIADWRRGQRANLDASGWMPWRGVQIAALFTALALTIVAVHG